MTHLNSRSIPLHKPYFDDRVFTNLRAVFESGKLSGDGTMCRQVEADLERLFSVRHALLTTSCTHAMEMAVRMLDLKPGDEVITPSFTFVSAANAILLGGGIPVFCEINRDTLTIDVEDAERRLTPRTRAIMPMHYAGVGADMDAVMALAGSHGLKVVEDAAQGINARYKGRYLGTIADVGTYSFHDTKNYVSGEGGAMVTNDEELSRRAEIIREKGTNRANFFRGEVDKYTWVGLGSSYILSEILAAVLKSQIDELETIQRLRREVHELYVSGLEDLQQKELLRLPVIPPACESNYHIFYILLRNEEERNRVMRELKHYGIGSAFHYVPLHSAPFAKSTLGLHDLQLPLTDRLAGSLLRIPLYPGLGRADIHYIIDVLHTVLL